MLLLPVRRLLQTKLLHGLCNGHKVRPLHCTSQRRTPAESQWEAVKQAVGDLASALKLISHTCKSNSPRYPTLLGLVSTPADSFLVTGSIKTTLIQQ